MRAWLTVLALAATSCAPQKDTKITLVPGLAELDPSTRAALVQALDDLQARLDQTPTPMDRVRLRTQFEAEIHERLPLQGTAIEAALRAQLHGPADARRDIQLARRALVASGVRFQPTQSDREAPPVGGQP